MRKILVIFGTRPEAIKMCPLLNELKTRPNFITKLCVTGQHKEMLAQVLDCFGVTVDYDLAIMKKNQDLFDVTAGILPAVKKVLEQERPDLILVHGDTTTTFVCALAAFYLHIPVGHVEAGLRTYQLDAPFPEEFNRQAVGIITAIHFAPTAAAKDHLLREGKAPTDIFVTGNTAIDALKTTVCQQFEPEHLAWASGSRLILLTAHRRENLGTPLLHIFRAVKQIVKDIPDVKILYPVHLNPMIQQAATQILGDDPRIRLIEPLDVIDFHNYLSRAYLVLTDSGGIQEEAPALGKPVLVLRNTTERPEGVAAGTLKLVGTDEVCIYRECKRLLTDSNAYLSMSQAANPYGDGTACKQIADILETILL